MEATKAMIQAGAQEWTWMRPEAAEAIAERVLSRALAEAVRPPPIGYVVLTRDDDRNRSLVATLAEAFADCADQDREWPQDGPHRVCALVPVGEVE